MQAEQDLLAQLERTEGYLGSDPENRDLLARAIDQALEAGVATRAEQHAQAALRVFPADPYFQYRYAHTLLAQSKYAEAAEIFQTLLFEHAEINIAVSLATCMQALRQFQGVVDVLTAFKEDPQISAQGLALFMRACHHIGDLEQGIATFRLHEERMTNEAGVLSVASLMFFDQGDVAEATRLSDAALALGVRPTDALLTSATLALGYSDTEKAIAQFNEVLARNPEEGRSWSGLGMASMLNQDLKSASEQLEKAVKYLPNHIGTVHTLGWCKIMAGEIPAAQALFQKALDMDRNFGESHGGMAVVQALKGEREAAEGSIERALRLDPAGMAARYAQMVLNGDTADPERFKALAMRVMAKRDTAFGTNLAEMVKRYGKQ